MFEVYVIFNEKLTPLTYAEFRTAIRVSDVHNVRTFQVSVRVESRTEANRIASRAKKLRSVKDVLVRELPRRKRDAEQTTQLPVVRDAQRALDAAERVTEKDRKRASWRKRKYD